MQSRSYKNPNTLCKQMKYWETYYSASDFVKIPLQNITKQDIRDFFTSMLQRFPMTYSHFKNVKTLLNLILEYAVDKEIIAVNKLSGMKFSNESDAGLFIPKAKHAKDEDSLDSSELQAIIREAERDFKERQLTSSLGIPISILTGVRIGELSALKFSDFDREHKVLTLSRMMIINRNEDDIMHSDGYKIVNGLKKHHEYRDLYVDDAVFDYVDIIRQKNKELGFPYGDDDYIFWRNNHNTNHETVICTTRTFDSHIRTYCKRCGFKYHYSNHDFRRTYISALGNAGVPLTDIQHQAGHTTPEMTMKYFREIDTKEEQKRVMNKAFDRLKKH